MQRPFLLPASAGAHGPEALLSAVGIVGVGLALLVGARVGPEWVLPAVSGLLLAIGFLVGLSARRRPGTSGRLTYGDVCGMLLLVGFAAALMSEPDQLLTATTAPTQILGARILP